MAVLVVICALVTALCIGYCLGRRAGSTPLTWKKRTSRLALGRLAINLLMLMTARRIRQGFPRLIEPLELLRGSAAQCAAAVKAYR